MAAAAAPVVRVQVVSTKATRLHCHSGPSAALEIGSDDAIAKDSNATKTAPAATAAASATPFLDHMVIMDLVPVDLCEDRNSPPGPMWLKSQFWPNISD